MQGTGGLHSPLPASEPVAPLMGVTASTDSSTGDWSFPSVLEPSYEAFESMSGSGSGTQSGSGHPSTPPESRAGSAEAERNNYASPNFHLSIPLPNLGAGSDLSALSPHYSPYPSSPLYSATSSGAANQGMYFTHHHALPQAQGTSPTLAPDFAKDSLVGLGIGMGIKDEPSHTPTFFNEYLSHF